jgi:thiol-disulfide isomerase/thioredoxin
MKFARQLALVALVGLLAACGSSSGLQSGDQIGYVSANGAAVLRVPSERGAVVDLVAPEISTGTSWKLSQHRGEVVLLNAWGPWCAPCRKELPELQKLQDRYATKGLLVIGLATRTNKVSVDAFTDKFKITIPQLEDFDSAALASIDSIPSSTVPGTIFIDRQGRVAGWALGAADPSLIRTLTRSLLEEKP